MSAADIAGALGLRRRRPRPGEWIGARGGAIVGVHASAPRGPGGAQAVRIFVEHRPSLRLGLLAVERRDARPEWHALDARSDLALPPAIEQRIRARAVEEAIARAVLGEAQSEIVACAASGDLGIDHQRAWLLFERDVEPPDAAPMMDELIALSSALTAARARHTAAFQGAIERTWAEVAGRAGLAFDPDRSVIAGEVRVVQVETRVDGEPGLLYTESYLEWPSFQLGLSLERLHRRGVLGRQPPQPDADRDTVADAFVRVLRARGAPRGGLPVEVMRSAMAIAAAGASLSVDDTGLVARLDRVVEDHETLRALVVDTLVIGTQLVAPQGPRGVYR